MTRAAVLDYDLGNLPSVTKALERIGVQARVVTSPQQVDADAMVVPGVGHFGTGMRNLRDRGFDTAIKDWAEAGRPLLGICVGLQLFMSSSDEERGEPGLGIVPGHVRRLTAPKVPHMGWNTLEVTPGAEVLSSVGEAEMAYFVHSYVVEPDDEGAVAARTTYGETFCSGVERGSVVGVQFHPEKSAAVGRGLLERFFERLT